MRNLYQQTKDRLKQGKIDSPDLDARIILKAVLNITDADLIAGIDKEISESEIKTIESFVQRRLIGEPVSKIIGRKEFWGLSFKVSKDVLDPRPDTETIIETALKHFGDNPPETILDLGVGSGCITIALLHEWPDTKAVAVDISESALNVAKENANTHNMSERIRFVQGGWDAAAGESFDLVVSNPPYIAPEEIANLSPEVKNHDPILALDGGKNGLQAYKEIFKALKPRLKEQGIGFFEIGYDQQKDVVRLVEDSGLFVMGVHADLAGQPRVVEISCGDK